MRTISFQSPLQTSTTPMANLAERAVSPDGRIWTYQKFSEAVSLGHVVVPVANVDVDTVSSSADESGAIIYITEASAGWTVGAYAEAFVLVDDGTGEGQHAKIRTNTTDTLILYKEYALTTALAVADSDIFIYRRGIGEKAAVTTKIQQAVGGLQVTNGAAINEYGWVLCGGAGVVIAGEVLTERGSFVTGDNTEGEVLKGTTAKGEFDEQTLGFVVGANTTADKGALVVYTIAAS